MGSASFVGYNFTLGSRLGTQRKLKTHEKFPDIQYNRLIGSDTISVIFKTVRNSVFS